MFYGNLYNQDQQRLLELTRSEIMVYCYLVSFGGKDRAVAASHKRIAEGSGVSVGSVKRALKKFEDLNWVSCAEYYQVKRYTLHRPESNDHQEEPKNDLEVGQHSDLPENKTVDHSGDLGVGQHVDLGVDHSVDLHVIDKEKKDKIYLHDMTADEKIFLNLLERWKNLAGWKIKESAKLLGDFRAMKKKYEALHFSLELRMIDAWLLKQHFTNSSRVWKYNFMGRIEGWFKRQVEQGARTTAVLSTEMKNYFRFAVSEDQIPDPTAKAAASSSAPKPSEPTSSKPLEEENEGFTLSASDKEFYESLPKHEKWVIDGMGLQGLQALKRKYKVS